MGRFHLCISCRAVVAFLLLTHRWRCSITAAHPSQSLYIQSMSQTHGSFPLWQTRCNEKKNISERKVLFLLVSALMLNKHPSTDFTGIMTLVFFPLANKLVETSGPWCRYKNKITSLTSWKQPEEKWMRHLQYEEESMKSRASLSLWGNCSINISPYLIENWAEDVLYSTTTSEQPQGGDCSRPLGTAACWEVHSRDKGQKVSERRCPEDSGHVGPVVLNSLCYFVETLVSTWWCHFLSKPVSVLCDFRIRTVWQSQFLTGSSSHCTETSSCDFVMILNTRVSDQYIYYLSVDFILPPNKTI